MHGLDRIDDHCRGPHLLRGGNDALDRGLAGRFVLIRGVASVSISSIGMGADTLLSALAGPAGATSSCAYEFHALQSGQRPSHFAD